MIYSGNHSSHIDNKPSSAYQTFDQNITILSDVSICKFRLQNTIQFIQGAVSIRKTVLPGMAIPMLKIRRPNGRLIFNMEITIRR